MKSNYVSLVIWLLAALMCSTDLGHGGLLFEVGWDFLVLVMANVQHHPANLIAGRRL